MIKRLILKGYKRLSLFLIDYIEITPENTLTFILGANGSGKSSLLRQCTPYPGHHQEFVKGGYKFIELDYLGKTYQLRSDFIRGTGTHSFFCVDTEEELNPGGTYRVQTELVEKFFKLDKELLDVLTGNKQFTAMSVNERRYWLQRLCPVDMSPAFKRYKYYSTRARDMKGAVRQLSERLVKDAKESIDPEALTTIGEEIERHHSRLMTLYPLIEKEKALASEDVLLDYEQALISAKEALDHYPTLVSSFRGSDKEAYEHELARLSQLIRDYTHTYKHTLDQCVVLKNEIEEVEASRQGDVSVNDLKAQLVTIEDTIATLIQQEEDTELPELLPSTLGMCNESFDGVISALLRTLAEIPENEKGYFSKERVEKARNAFNEATRQIKVLDQKVIAVAGRIENIRQCESVTCPNCQHGFKPGVDPKEEGILLKQIDEYNQHITTLKEKLGKCEQYLADFDVYYNAVMGYQQLVRQYPTMAVLWDYCNEHKVATRTPSAFIIPISAWRDEMTRRNTLLMYSTKKKDYQEKITFLEGIDQKRLEKITQQYQQYSHQIGELKEKITSYTEAHKQLEKDYNAIASHQTEADKAMYRLICSIEALYGLIDKYFQDSISEEVSLHQSRLSQLEQERNRFQIMQSTREVITQERERAKEDQRLYEILVEALNPNTGLIADYLSASMGNVVERMNAVINHVWSYPLEIGISPVDKNELTYRFPMYVGEDGTVCKDISEGSSAQQDIVNFSFVLTVVSCLELKGMPFLIDELGASFDEEHRGTLIGLIDSMLELGELKQVFFISHYQSTHSAFYNADYCVLNTKNITVPQHYNTHVTFTEPS